jgi:hypothetical protein
MFPEEQKMTHWSRGDVLLQLANKNGIQNQKKKI